MKEEWQLLISRHNIAGARNEFEKICALLFKSLNQRFKTVRVSQGDGGIDIFLGNIGIEPIDVIQCKFFPDFGDSQKNQISKSFKTALNSTEYEMKSWTLCVANEFTIEEHKWWTNWKNKKSFESKLSESSIRLLDGLDIIDLLKKEKLYDTAFDQTDSLRIKEIYDIVSKDLIIPKDKVETTLKKSSHALQRIKNYFGKSITTHIPREETSEIYHWIQNELKNDAKNVLLLSGEKGIGKSVVLKDLYDILIKDDYQVLGIKADKYYFANIKDLENNLFLSNLTFDSLIQSISLEKKLVIIIDQIDALSYSITSNREFLNTYNRLISEFESEENLRVIISTRTYDLKYDAELSEYNSKAYKHLTVKPLSSEDVVKILHEYNIAAPSQKFVELLQNPNNLNIFCSLPNKAKINFDSVSSLKDLYDKLWFQLISEKRNKKIKDLIFDISNRMYDQGIAVANIYNDEYYEELNYLKSNNLITEIDNTLQFSHQTFYEYCYAKQFVERNQPLAEFIFENEQSLYIRSVVKIVTEYLREFNVKQYIETIKNILFDNKFRFHIKTLIISCVSVQQKLSKHEKNFIVEYILNSEVEEIFLTSLFSPDWILFVIDERIFDGHFDSDKRGIIWSLFARNINFHPLKILNYLETLEFSDKHNFIAGLIIYIDNWETKEQLDFFTKYLLYQEPTRNDLPNMWYYKTLEKIYIHHPNFVYEKIEYPLLKTYGDYQHDMEYSLNGLIEEIGKNNPKGVFYFLLKTLKKAVSKSKFPLISELHKIETPFYDSCHNISSLSTIHAEKTIVHHLNILVDKLPEKDFLHFFEEYKNDNDVNVLNTIIHGLHNRNLRLNHLIIEQVKIIEQKKGFEGRDDNFQLGLRKLIAASFHYFKNEDKDYIINLYLKMKCIYDTYVFNDGKKRSYSLRNYGEKKFVFIKSLPSEVIVGNEKLKKEYQVLLRKFGDIDHNNSLHEGKYQSGVVGSPLSQSAYTKMNLNSWKKSMLKFNETYKSKEFLKGGMREHSIAFKETVSKNPEKFYDFINEISENKNINVCYLSQGIDGLIEGKYDPEKVKQLYKKLIKKDLDREYTLYSNWKARYFLETNTIDKEIVEHICDVARNYPVKEKDHNPNHLLTDSLNSVRGSAIDILMHLCEHKEHEELIFSTIEDVINDCNLSVKAAIVHNIAYLNHLDIPRAFNIFKKLFSTKENEILKHSINSGQYYNNSFHEEMEDYIVDLMENESTQETSYILVKSYIEEKVFGLKYYNKFIAKGKPAITCVLKVAEAYLFNKGKLDNRALNLLYQFLDNEDEEISREYDAIILRKFMEKDFVVLYDFMLAYSKSKVCKRSPHYFLEYLIKCSKDYPDECLNLLSNIDFTRAPNIQQSGYYDKEPVQLVLGIYSKFLTTKTDKKKIEKCLDIFDSMLQHNHLRNNANKAIELLSE